MLTYFPSHVITLHSASSIPSMWHGSGHTQCSSQSQVSCVSCLLALVSSWLPITVVQLEILSLADILYGGFLLVDTTLNWELVYCITVTRLFSLYGQSLTSPPDHILATGYSHIIVMYLHHILKLIFNYKACHQNKKLTINCNQSTHKKKLIFIGLNPNFH